MLMKEGNTMRLKRTVAGLAAAAMSVSSLGLNSLAVFADDAKPWENATATSIIGSHKDEASNSASHVGDEYSGYILSNENTQTLSYDYYKISFTVDGDVTDDTIVFDLQPYDTSWQGWNDNFVKIGDCEYDTSTLTYTAYVDVAGVKGTLSTGGTLKGINLNFYAAEPVVTLTGFDGLTVGEVEEPFVQYIKYTITEKELNEANVNWSGASRATVYVHMTKGGADSKINAMIRLGPDNDSGTPIGKASSKYLSGRNVASGNAIQDDLVGKAGTGDYAFPEVNLNKSLQDGGTWLSEYAEEFQLDLRVDTPDTDFEFLGIKFNNGAVYPKDFTVPTVEAATYDSTEVEPEKATAKELLKMTLDYCATMDESKYQEASWTALQNELKKAQDVYNNASSTDANFTAARASLEKVKADMLFKDTDTEKNPVPYRDLTNAQLVKEMGTGTNLGNTMDGHSSNTPSETAWQSAMTTKAYIKALHDAGYNSIRIPVTWGNMINDDYTIKDIWIGRVQDIVDYAVEQDMYAIINIHHDGVISTGGWLDTSVDDIDKVYEKYENTWRYIAEYFKDYDEHLIFESFNEVSCMDTNESMKNSSEAVNYDTPILVNMNQIFVNVVRSTGSNNKTRWLAAVSHYANNGTSKLFTMPTDSYNTQNRLMFAAHIYSDLDGTMSRLEGMYNKFKSYPMYLGEYGNRLQKADTESGYNDVERAYYCEQVNRQCQKYGIVPMTWDQGFGDKGELETGLYSYWNRVECRPIFKTITDALVRGAMLTDAQAAVVNDPTIVPITSITPETEELTLTVGETATVSVTAVPAKTNDVVLWSTDDDKVATVFNGMVRAKGIGSTTINVYSQNGDVRKQITVNVFADEESEVTAINAEGAYNIITGKYVYLNASVEPENANSTLSYKSSNEDVAIVNSEGKVVGISSGSAYVVITAVNGLTKTVLINVSDVELKNEMNLALHVLYNDSTHNYWSAELSQPVKVTGDGQYTLSFDLEKEISAAAKAAGITEINNLTAIYIKDLDVTNGDAIKSPVTSAMLRYDEVKVNGTALTVNSDQFYNVLNTVNVFDSGKPINAWDGSVVDEVTAPDDNHSARFTTITNPTNIEVTFTLKDVVFVGPSSSDKIEATIIKRDKAKIVTIEEEGGTADLPVLIAPKNTDSLVSFSSNDSSIAVVSNEAVAVDPATGLASVTVTARKNGRAVITASTDNGLSVDYFVDVKIPEEPDTFDVSLDIFGTSDLETRTDEDLTVSIQAGGEDIAAGFKDGNVDTKLEAGEYVLNIGGGNYVSRSLAFSVDEEGKVTIDESKLFVLKKGDVNGDGKIDTKDALKLIAAAKKTTPIKDEYLAKVADLNADGEIKTDDAMKVIRAAKKEIDLWK